MNNASSKFSRAITKAISLFKKKPPQQKPSLIRIAPYKNLQSHENVQLSIGPGGKFNGMVILNDGAAKNTPRAVVTIGTNFHSGKGCVIRTSDHDFSRGYPLVDGKLAGYKTADVTIGDHVWLGNDVLVMKGVTIGYGAIIQARSVVVSNIPPLAIAGGHPCRAFASRDPEEYHFLKSLNLANVRSPDVAEKSAWFEQQLAAFKANRRRH